MNIYHSLCPSCGNEADHLMDGTAIAVRCVHCGYCAGELSEIQEQHLKRHRKTPAPSDQASRHPILTSEEFEALTYLIRLAKSNTGQCRRAANFLLSWWNSASCGSFDLTDLWGLDDEITQAMQVVIRFLCRRQVYPDTLGFKDDFQAIIRQWRPHLLEEEA
ncbi:hypothetical protein ACEK07_46960 [Alcanivoracaceae bacterium MT1]